MSAESMIDDISRPFQLEQIGTSRTAYSPWRYSRSCFDPAQLPSSGEQASR